MDMRDIIKIVTEAKQAGTLLDRSAFLYMDPKGPNKDEFAQCSSCGAFKPYTKRCTLFSKNDYVKAEASCGLYIKGEPDEKQEILNLVTPKEAGYVEGKVRCENCKFFADGKCALFAQLNEMMPNTFNLDVSVKAKGCCNAFQSL